MTTSFDNDNCNDYKHIDIESDLNDSLNCRLLNLQDMPQVTIFKDLYALRRFTHYRRWTDFAYGKKTLSGDFDGYRMCIQNKNFDTINCINNALFVVEFSHTFNNDSDKNNALKNIFNADNRISITLGSLIFLDCGFDVLLEMLKMHRAAYDKMSNTLVKFNRLEIPIHNLIFKRYLVLAMFTEYGKDYVIDMHIQNKDIKETISNCYLNYEAIQLTNCEYKRFAHCGSELKFHDYYYEYHETTDDNLKIQLKGDEIIRDISVKIINGTSNKVTMDDRPLTKTTDPFYTHYMNEHLPKTDISYMLSSTLTGISDSDSIYTGHIQGKHSKTIIVSNANKGKQLKLLLVIKYDNFIGSDGSMYFKYGYDTKDTSNGSSYPLTKISEEEYIEGYWALARRNYISPTYEPKYPLPKESTIDVNVEFLSKLNTMTKNSVSIDTESNSTESNNTDSDNIKSYSKNNRLQKNTVYITDYFGFSSCRLCDCANGGSEYTAVNDNGIRFRFPNGLLHYYEKHKVQPSKEFHNFVMNFQI